MIKLNVINILSLKNVRLEPTCYVTLVVSRFEFCKIVL